MLQLLASAAFMRRRPRAFVDVRQLVMGGAGGAADEARIALGVARRADCVVNVNAPMAEVHAALGRATLSIHTMRAEHFGFAW